MFRLHKV